MVKIFFRSDEDVFSNIIQKNREKLISILDVCRECIRLVNNEEAIDKFYSDLYIEYPFLQEALSHQLKIYKIREYATIQEKANGSLKKLTGDQYKYMLLQDTNRLLLRMLRYLKG